MSEYVDVEPDGEPIGLAVVLPGRRYRPDQPLLHFTVGVLRDRGWRVRTLWWEPPDLEPDATAAWAGAELAAAVGDHDGAVLVVGKSLGTFAASYAAERRWPAIWLTPVLAVEPVVDGIRRNEAEQLLVGGTADDIGGWDSELTEDLPADVLEVAGADHLLEIPGHAVASAALLGELMDAVDDWIGETDLIAD